MEIVINRCFGGFSLSSEAEYLYAEKSGFKLYRYTQINYKHRDGKNLYVKINNNEKSMFSSTFKKDHGSEFSEWPKDKDSGYWYSNDIERTDPVLLDVVNELGGKANGSCAQLEIVEIPDGVNWEIDEYDGNESIHEVHRSW